MISEKKCDSLIFKGERERWLDLPKVQQPELRPQDAVQQEAMHRSEEGEYLP